MKTRLPCALASLVLCGTMAPCGLAVTLSAGDIVIPLPPTTSDGNPLFVGVAHDERVSTTYSGAIALHSLALRGADDTLIVRYGLSFCTNHYVGSLSLGTWVEPSGSLEVAYMPEFSPGGGPVANALTVSLPANEIPDVGGTVTIYNQLLINYGPAEALGSALDFPIFVRTGVPWDVYAQDKARFINFGRLATEAGTFTVDFIGIPLPDDAPPFVLPGIPEPTAAALLALGVGALCLRRRTT